MNGSLSGDRIFLPFYLQNYCEFLNRVLKRASTGPIDARTRVITEELPSSTKECSIRQIMNHFIQIHILFGPAERTGWHVACEGTGLLKSF